MLRHKYRVLIVLGETSGFESLLFDSFLFRGHVFVSYIAH